MESWPRNDGEIVQRPEESNKLAALKIRIAKKNIKCHITKLYLATYYIYCTYIANSEIQ